MASCWGLQEFLWDLRAEGSQACPWPPQGHFTAGQCRRLCPAQGALCQAHGTALLWHTLSVTAVTAAVCPRTWFSAICVIWRNNHTKVKTESSASGFKPGNVSSCRLQPPLRPSRREHVRIQSLKFDWKCLPQLILCCECCSGNSLLWKLQKAAVNRNSGCWVRVPWQGIAFGLVVCQFQIDLTTVLVFLRICVDDGNASMEKRDCESGIWWCRRVRCGRSESLEKKKACTSDL